MYIELHYTKDDLDAIQNNLIPYSTSNFGKVTMDIKEKYKIPCGIAFNGEEAGLDFDKILATDETD